MNDYSRLPSKTAANLGKKSIYSQSAVSNIFFWFLGLAFYHKIGAIIIKKYQHLVPYIQCVFKGIMDV